MKSSNKSERISDTIIDICNRLESITDYSQISDVTDNRLCLNIVDHDNTIDYKNKILNLDLIIMFEFHFFKKNRYFLSIGTEQFICYLNYPELLLLKEKFKELKDNVENYRNNKRKGRVIDILDKASSN